MQRFVLLALLGIVSASQVKQIDDLALAQSTNDAKYFTWTRTSKGVSSNFPDGEYMNLWCKDQKPDADKIFAMSFDDPNMLISQAFMSSDFRDYQRLCQTFRQRVKSLWKEDPVYEIKKQYMKDNKGLEYSNPNNVQQAAMRLERNQFEEAERDAKIEAKKAKKAAYEAAKAARAEEDYGDEGEDDYGNEYGEEYGNEDYGDEYGNEEEDNAEAAAEAAARSEADRAEMARMAAARQAAREEAEALAAREEAEALAARAEEDYGDEEEGDYGDEGEDEEEDEEEDYGDEDYGDEYDSFAQTESGSKKSDEKPLNYNSMAQKISSDDLIHFKQTLNALAQLEL